VWAPVIDYVLILLVVAMSMPEVQPPCSMCNKVIADRALKCECGGLNPLAVSTNESPSKVLRYCARFGVASFV
jgi:hypothetical protein